LSNIGFWPGDKTEALPRAVFSCDREAITLSKFGGEEERDREIPKMAPSAISPPSGSGQSNSPRDVPLLNGNYLAHAESQDLNSPDDHLDLLCVGFGPASLAIAIALHDAEKTRSHPAKTLFLERQPQFAWHAGMQLPGAKMQISFLKDLATPRDPTSQFTFVNYLFQKGRFNTFVNLGTFLPSRLEYEDYLRWCASHFEKEGKVAYGMDVEGVRIGEKDTHGRVTSFAVTARAQNGEMITRRARHVVIAVGGRPVIPLNLQGLKHVSHSSQFANAISKIQAQDIKRPLRFAVIGSGQSAAEIFSHLWSSFPDAQVSLVIKGASLRPSDDSPL
jgi:L-ornithine N5-oxygenase